MSVTSTQRQYDELIADNYDQDPLSLTSDTLNKALAMIDEVGCLDRAPEALSVLDLGMGTGLFFDQLQQIAQREILPYGIDISARMLDVAHRRIPNLKAAVDDAANLEQHFQGESFDLICTHFVTGFVRLAEIAPKIWDKLRPGGYWSFVGATSSAYPGLQKKASSRLIQMLLGNKRLELNGLITPKDQLEVESIALGAGFEICQLETDEPNLHFRNFDDFLQFSYQGGWLTPYIESLGLQNARPSLRMMLNTFVFPMRDHHTIVLGLMEKPSDG